MVEGNKRLGDILLEKKVITESLLKEALKEQKQGERLEDILTKKGIDEKTMYSALSEYLGIAFVKVEDVVIDDEIRRLINKKVCLNYNIFPIFKIRNTLTVAMSFPIKEEVIRKIEDIANIKVRPVLAPLSAIKRAIKKNYPDDYVKETSKSFSVSSVVETVNRIIYEAIKLKASDIHFEPRKTSFNLRFRCDGILYEKEELSKREMNAIISRIKVLASLNIVEKRLPQDGRMQMEIEGRTVDMRVSTFPTIYGENVVVRILDPSRGLLKLKDLGLSEEDNKKLLSLIHKPYGLLLVTGPTGSGKTTTLYAMLNEINTIEKNIMTLEDPVEYELALIRQSQINPKAGLTFASGLRSLLRQDPDIIMIGEIRDYETAEIAIHAALTGHLVISTLHTNDAPSSFTRLVDMGVEPYLVASSVIGVIAQRLVRVLCNKCKKPASVSVESQKYHISLDDNLFYEPGGCEECRKLGYWGRVGIFEILIPNDRIKSLIVKQSAAGEIKEEAKRIGMKTLRENGLEKVKSGITSLSEVLRVT